MITEVGSSREKDIIDLKMKNLRRLLEEPVTVHGYKNMKLCYFTFSVEYVSNSCLRLSC